MSALFLLPLIFVVAGATTAAGVGGVSAAQAACDEQAGEFHREGASVYCDVNGVVFESREERSARPAQVHPARLASTAGQAAVLKEPEKSTDAVMTTKNGGASRHRRSLRTKTRR